MSLKRHCDQCGVESEEVVRFVLVQPHAIFGHGCFELCGRCYEILRPRLPKTVPESIRPVRFDAVDVERPKTTWSWREFWRSMWRG